MKSSVSEPGVTLRTTKEHRKNRQLRKLIRTLLVRSCIVLQQSVGIFLWVSDFVTSLGRLDTHRFCLLSRKPRTKRPFLRTLCDEILAEETMAKRRELLPKLKRAKEEGKVAYFSYDKLIIKDRPTSANYSPG